MRVVLVSTNAGQSMGGEAIKAYQYFKWLLAAGYDATLVTHERCRDQLTEFAPERIVYVRDDRLQISLWRARVTKRLLNGYFHRCARRLISDRFDPSDTVVHYLCPISPVELRFPPKGFRYVIGPLSGYVFYPPAFRAREGRGAALRRSAYPVVQRLSRLFFGELRGADRILVSGYERTRRVLKWAGAGDAQMVDVVDAGVSEDIADAPAPDHTARNGAFVWIGRFTNYKGADLALRALALSDADITLTLYGDGPERSAMEALARSLGVADRALFAGWLDHDAYVQAMTRYRGLVFPTLSEANGIVIQEAMACGVPVVSLDWGGPSGLASAGEAVLIAPESEEHVIHALAKAMARLAEGGAEVQKMADAARARAQAFRWDVVARSWAQVYDRS
ncbi:glycosyltransferase family 4 protein [Celeribacter sp.]|uniref:glycosyltransferase family 4 protein n=1 Tax=Celeribacter sp. TaxID=1890673 RepID=UPI003A91713D